MKLPREQIAIYTALFVAALTFRLTYLTAAPLWYDEAFTALLTRLPLADAMRAVYYDAHPPLYFWLMWHWVHWFGESHFSLRIVSALFGAAWAPLIYALALAYKLPQPRALWAAAIVCLLPFGVQMSQEARMYSLLVTVALCYMLAWEHPKAIYATPVLAFALVSVHYYGALIAAAVFFTQILRGRALIPLWLSHMIAAFVYSLSNSQLFVQVGEFGEAGLHWMPPLHPAGIISTLGIVALGNAGGILALVIAGFGVAYLLTHKPAVEGVILLVFFAIVLTISLLFTNVMFSRGLAIVAPLAALYFARRATPRWFALAMAVCAIGTVGVWQQTPTIKAAHGAHPDLIAYMLFHPGNYLASDDGMAVSLGVYGYVEARLPEVCNDHLGDLSRETRGILLPQRVSIPGEYVIHLDGILTSQCENQRLRGMYGEPIATLAGGEFAKIEIYRHAPKLEARRERGR